MSKYDVLRDHLQRQTGYVDFTLDELDALIPGGLPPSARQYEIWWMNNDPSHHHSRSWGEAGYRVQVDLARKHVRFVPN